MITFSQALVDPNLFGPFTGGESWRAWQVIAKALYAELLDADELAIFAELTGRTEAPAVPAEEAWLAIGRRGGKDVFSSAAVVYLATIGVERFGLRKRLQRGERGVVQLLAVDRNQAGVAMGYIKGFLEVPVLAEEVKKLGTDTVELRNGVNIEVATNSVRSIRGRTTIAAILDECAHWRSDDSANPDRDVYAALKPAMATMAPHALILGISSPYARRGLLYDKITSGWAQPGPVLCARAPTWVTNPTLSRESDFIAKSYEDDPDHAAAEFGAEFRSDISAFLTRDAVEACIEEGVRERPPDRRCSYAAFVDPSGGSADSMTLAIAHAEGSTVVLDLIREVRPPFSPEAVVAEFAQTVRAYRCPGVHGDRYGGEWVAEAFRKAGVAYLYDRVPPKSQLYVDALPIINSRAAVLLDDRRMISQLVALERRTTRGGRDTIDHPSGGHDDVANAAAGALVISAKSTSSFATVQDRYHAVPGQWTEQGLCMPPPPAHPPRRNWF